MKVKIFDEELLRNYRIPLITVYYNTSDYPNKYVARLFDMNIPTSYHIVGSSYWDIRGAIPSRMTRIERDPNDDKVIVEVWV